LDFQTNVENRGLNGIGFSPGQIQMRFYPIKQNMSVHELKQVLKNIISWTGIVTWHNKNQAKYRN